jgi:hypothetical protein
MTHRVNARVESMQATSVGSAVDGAPRIAERPGQLTNRNHSMLPFREICK